MSRSKILIIDDDLDIFETTGELLKYKNPVLLLTARSGHDRKKRYKKKVVFLMRMLRGYPL